MIFELERAGQRVHIAIVGDLQRHVAHFLAIS